VLICDFSSIFAQPSYSDAWGGHSWQRGGFPAAVSGYLNPQSQPV